MKLRIATYNTSHSLDYRTVKGDGEATVVDLPMTAGILTSMDSDIVGLNEIYSIGSEEVTNQTEKLAALADYPFSKFARGTLFPWGADIGNALLSRFPILHVDAVAVPAPTEAERRPNETKWYEDRVILVAQLDCNGQTVRFISTHFGLNGQEQEHMMATLLTLLDDTTLPTILAGDFNNAPDAAILAPLYDRMQSAARETGNRDNTFPSWGPDRTLDYIFLSPAFRILDYEVSKVVASDHLPIRATVELT